MREKIPLWNRRKIVSDQELPSVRPFLLRDGKKHPGVLVIPGGGYGCVCESTEGSPIAKAFNFLGFQAFVLHYRFAPHAFPAPLEDAARAMKIIRGRTEEWEVIPDRVASCGFSAGGHLAGALGTIVSEVDASDGDAFDAEDPVPDGMILSYGVLSFKESSHRGSVENFCGVKNPPKELTERFSLENRVTEKTPPAFVWHTFRDQWVDYRNSLLFADAMAKAKRPCELHIFNDGDHGMLLGWDTPCEVWPAMAKRFLMTQWELRGSMEKQACYTNAYQGKRNAVYSDDNPK